MYTMIMTNTFEYEIEKAPVIDCDRKKVLWSYIQE